MYRNPENEDECICGSIERYQKPFTPLLKTDQEESLPAGKIELLQLEPLPA